MMNEINAYIEEIKNYSEKHTELKKSHHFCFNVPIPTANNKPELNKGDEIVLIMGQNPGELDVTWNYFPENLESNTKDLFRKMKTPIEIKEKVAEMVDNKQQISGYPVEETSNNHFWSDPNTNNWRDNNKEVADSSHDKWQKKIKKICENNCKKNNLTIVQTEYFFWSTNGIDVVKGRFGFDWEANPHEEFCSGINKKLIDYYNTKIIIYFGISDADRIKKTFNLEEVEIYKVPEPKKNKKILAKLCFLKRVNRKDIPFLICTHISKYISNKEIECMKLLSEYICDNDGKAMPQDKYKDLLD
tara:strand:+ start:13 stop:918 length:906 start_codon:yes stop_codon:yes gene_type:complete